MAYYHMTFLNVRMANVRWAICFWHNTWYTTLNRQQQLRISTKICLPNQCFPIRSPPHHDHSNQEYINESAFRSSRFGVMKRSLYLQRHLSSKSVQCSVWVAFRWLLAETTEIQLFMLALLYLLNWMMDKILTSRRQSANSFAEKTQQS